MEDTEPIKQLYFIDEEGNYYKCHKLLPDIRRIFGDIEYMNGEPVEIIPNKERKTMETTTIKPPEIDTYYDRTKNKDGTFEKRADKINQKRVAEAIRKVWGAEVLEYPQTSPIDFYISRNGRECFGDAKTAPTQIRDHAILNMRKYCCLMDAGRLWECSTFLFLYDKTGMYYVKAEDLGDRIECERKITGSKKVKANCDIEPALFIPKSEMTKLA